MSASGMETIAKAQIAKAKIRKLATFVEETPRNGSHDFSAYKAGSGSGGDRESLCWKICRGSL